MINSKQLKFNEKKHEYRVGKKKLMPVTKWCAKFFSPFNDKEVARNLAKLPQNKAQKRGVRYWLNEWKKSAEHGSHVHKHIEDYINGDYTLPDFKEERDGNKFMQSVGYLQKSITKKDSLYPELKIYDELLGLAGTIDLLVQHDDKSLSIVDWKTNKESSIKKPQRITPKTKMAKSPFDFLVDGSYSKYCLQLSVYAYMLERQGYKIHKLYIVHLLEETYLTYEVPYKDIKKAIEVYFDEQRT